MKPPCAPRVQPPHPRHVDVRLWRRPQLPGQEEVASGTHTEVPGEVTDSPVTCIRLQQIFTCWKSVCRWLFTKCLKSVCWVTQEGYSHFYSWGVPSFVPGEAEGLASSGKITAWERNHTQHIPEGSGLWITVSKPHIKTALEIGLWWKGSLQIQKSQAQHIHMALQGPDRTKAALPHPPLSPFQSSPRTTHIPVSWQLELTFILVFVIWNIRGQDGWGIAKALLQGVEGRLKPQGCPVPASQSLKMVMTVVLLDLGTYV